MKKVVRNEGSDWSFAIIDGKSILTEIGPYRSRKEVMKAIEVSQDFIKEVYNKKGENYEN